MWTAYMNKHCDAQPVVLGAKNAKTTAKHTRKSLGRGFLFIDKVSLYLRTQNSLK